MKLQGTARQVCLILLLALIATAVSALVHPKRPAWYRVVSPEELRWQIDLVKAEELASSESVLWVDARSRKKYEESHLPGAILLNLAEWGDLMFEHMDALQDAMSKPVIVYCDGTDCRKSATIASQLRELLGLEPVYVLKGNWRELSAAKAP